ncbi:MAG: bifunctional glutamate N-acetyltransferase/amino-acid acetyltransferase ArgJ [Solirubrobacteraceae bacterium]
MSLFASRWVKVPGHVRELSLEAGLPAGFRASGVACGIKPSGRPDLGMVVCDEEHCVSAARFTTNASPAAPVQLTRERSSLAALRAVLVNSGCANAATGSRGLEDAERARAAAAAAVGLEAEQVAVASTGSISHFLPMERVLAGVQEAAGALRSDGDVAFQRAIETTDSYEKRAVLEVALSAGTVRVAAQCKGAGMISPRFATMLCFVQTDADLYPGGADALLGRAVSSSFDRISVDGQLSTNDTVVLLASGACGTAVQADSEDALLFGEALEALLRALAIRIVSDGEGARRIARVRVHGARREDAENVARGVACSPLVKAALHGGDPNWGRILQAVGGALAGWIAPPGEPREAPDSALPVRISVEGIEVCARGEAVAVDEAALRQAVAREEVEYEIWLGGDAAQAEVYFSDLSREYVTANAEYTT